MKIKLNLNIFLFIVLFFLSNQIEVYALVMVFALIHELAHLVCGVIIGLKPITLKIMPFGFKIEFEMNLQDYNKKIGKSNILAIKKIIIALAGPLINFFIAILGILVNLNSNIIYANFLICLFNLIPIYPLDGGRILKNILKILVGNKKANRYINIVSNTFAIILTMFSSIFLMIYKNIAMFLVIITIWGLVIKENQKYSTYNKIYKVIDKNYNYL